MALLTTCLRCAVSGEMTIFVLSFGAVIGAVRALQDRMELRLAEHIDSAGVSGFCWPRARNRLYSARLRAPLFLSGGTDAAAIACLPSRIVCPASRYSQPQIFHCILTEKIPAAVPVCRIRDAAGPEAGCRFPPSRDTAGSPSLSDSPGPLMTVSGFPVYLCPLSSGRDRIRYETKKPRTDYLSGVQALPVKGRNAVSVP